MSIVYGAHFEYAGKSSREYGLIFARIETEEFTQLSGESESQSIFNKKTRKKYLIGNDYSSSPLFIDAEIVTEDGRILDREEQKEIQRWLFSNNRFNKLYFDVQDDCEREMYEDFHGDIIRSYLNCKFVNSEKLNYNNGVVGYRFTIECDSNMSWQDKIREEYQINWSNKTYKKLIYVNDELINTIENINGSIIGSNMVELNIKIDTEDDEYIYPKMQVTMNSIGGDFLIMNLDDKLINTSGIDISRTMSFEDVGGNAILTINSDSNHVSGNYYNNMIDRNFIRLKNHNNRIRIRGGVSKISFEYQNRRFL